MTEEARDILTKIGMETSLRYAIHLITAAHLVAKKRKVTAKGYDSFSLLYKTLTRALDIL